MKKQVEIAIVGASGLIGETLLSKLAEHPWLTGRVSLLGAEESLGQAIEFGRQELIIGDVYLFDFKQVQVVVASGDEIFEEEWLERALEAGCVVLDIGSHLLENSDLPPVVATVNPEVLSAFTHGGIITLPDAATTQLTTLLKPIADRVGINRASVFSCHAISDMGRSGVEEMARQTVQLLNGKPAKPLLFPTQIAFNLLPFVGEVNALGVTQAEQRMVAETSGILGREDLKLSVTCSWAPVFFGHSQAINLSTLQPTTTDELNETLAGFADIDVIQASDSSLTAVTDASGKDTLTVGRVRSSQDSMTEFSLWAVADNLRFGIAGNIVRILEVLVKDYL